MNESRYCNTNDSQCEKGIVKNLMKMTILILLGISLFVYMIVLLTGAFSKKPAALIKSTNPAEIESAKNILDNINKDVIVKNVKEIKNSLIVTIDLEKWKKLDRKEKKDFIKKIGKSQTVLGQNPSVRVIDERNVEHASLEHNRVSIGDFDF